MAKLNLFKKKPVTQEDLEGIKGFLSNKDLKEGYYPLDTVGFGAKKYAGYIVYIDSDGKALDIITEVEMPTHQQSIENINKEKKAKLAEEKLIAKRSAELNVNRKENIAKLNAMKGDSDKINDRYENAEIRYGTARAKLEEYVAGEMGTTTRERNQEKYERKLRELQNTAKYKDLANKEIQALKRFFKVSNALSGLSNELAAGDPDYQAIDYNQKVQDLVAPAGYDFGAGNVFAGATSGLGPRQIPESDPSSIYRSEVRDYVSPERSEKLEERKHKQVLEGVVEGPGETKEEKAGYSARMLGTVSKQAPEPTPLKEYSTDELIELLIQENKKKK